MSFNWRYAIGAVVVVEAASFIYPPWGQFVGALGVILGSLLFSRVVRHNVAQCFHAGGHQWLGDGTECEACSK